MITSGAVSKHAYIQVLKLPLPAFYSCPLGLFIPPFALDRNVIAGVTSGLPSKPSVRQVHERSKLVDAYRTTTQGIADFR